MRSPFQWHQLYLYPCGRNDHINQAATTVLVPNFSRITSSVEKSASFRNVPRPKSRLYESVRPSTKLNSGAQSSSVSALAIEVKKCCTEIVHSPISKCVTNNIMVQYSLWEWMQGGEINCAGEEQKTQASETGILVFRWNWRSKWQNSHLISKREGLLFSKVEILGIVVNNFRGCKATSLASTHEIHEWAKLTFNYKQNAHDKFLSSNVACWKFSGYDLITAHTLAHAFAIPSKVTYLEPLMLYTCPYAFSFASTFTNAFARSCNQTLSVSYLVHLKPQQSWNHLSR